MKLVKSYWWFTSRSIYESSEGLICNSSRESGTSEFSQPCLFSKNLEGNLSLGEFFFILFYFFFFFEWGWGGGEVVCSHSKKEYDYSQTSLWQKGKISMLNSNQLTPKFLR